MAQIATALKQVPDHGQRIWVYCNIRTRQTVYSLTRALDNKTALAQIPFLVKKSKPASLRKDHWTPLCVIDLPSSNQGLRAYKELREFQKRHYMEWDFPDLELAGKRAKARRLMDQKANSVADIADVLARQYNKAIEQAENAQTEVKQNADAIAAGEARLSELKIEKRALLKAGDEESLKKAKVLKAEKIRLAKDLAKPDVYSAVNRKYSLVNDTRPPAKTGFGRLRGQPAKPLFSMDRVRIFWDNVLDAEYAAKWPENVIQDVLSKGWNRSRYNGVVPEGAAEDVDDEHNVPTGISAPAESAPEPGNSRLRDFVDRLQKGSKDKMAV